ncbi:unnamed protein product [Calypogeia fissa]
MAMAFLEEEADEGLYDEVLLAAVDAAVARRLAGIPKQQHQNQNQQQNQHHRQILHAPPPLPYSAPQKKLTITHLSSSAAEDLKPPLLPSATVALSSHHHHQYAAASTKNDVMVVAKAPQISSMNHNPQNVPSIHRDGRMSSGVSRDVKPQGFMKNTPGATGHWSGPGPGHGTGGPDVKPNEYLKNNGGGGGGGGGGMVSSGAGGRGGDVKREEFSMIGSAASAAARNGRRPLQELQPWVGSNQIVERPSSTSTWVQAEKMSCSPKGSDGAWFSGLSGVAMFRECQDAAMRTLVPSDYTIMNGKPYIKKTGWRKIAFFFNLSFEIKDKNIQFDQQANVLRAEFVVRASMPSGRYTDSWGSCDRGEKRFSKPNHDIPSTAETRAKTRACQDLLGIGDYKSDGSH